MAYPSPPGSVSTIYDASQAHRGMQDTWSQSPADGQWSSSCPMPFAQAQGSAAPSSRPDGHPEREASLPHFDNSPAGHYTGRLHRQTLCPSIDPPHAVSPSAAAAPAVPAPRPALIERVDGFLSTLPLSAADKAVDSGIVSARRLGRAVSKRINRKQTISPIIGLPHMVTHSGKEVIDTVPVSHASADTAAAARRHQIWLESLPPVRTARGPPPSSLGPFTDTPPAAATPSAVPAAIPRPGAEARRVIQSTWGDLCEAANPAGTIAGYENGKPVTICQQSQPSRDRNPTEMTKTISKPVHLSIDVHKPLPEVPRPNSLRRQTVMRRRTVRNTSDIPSAGDGDNLYGTSVPPDTASSTRSSPFDLKLSARLDNAQAARQSLDLDGRFRPDDGSSDDGRPVVDQFVRAGHVSTYAHQVHDGQTVNSWHVQHAVAPTSPSSEHSLEDGAPALWRRMETESGIRMRD